jgi:hypothetical protein
MICFLSPLTLHIRKALRTMRQDRGARAEQVMDDGSGLQNFREVKTVGTTSTVLE